VKGLTWKLGILTSLACLPLLAPFCAKDDCYDRGGAIRPDGATCQLGTDRVEPLRTWSWPLGGWLYFLAVGATPGVAVGAAIPHLQRRRRAHPAA
jgi:hypothetical protein